MHNRELIKNVPHLPGVYIMKNKQGSIFYIGKALNLKTRLDSYFNSGDNRAFVALLDTLLDNIETIVTNSEKEALILENQLIKKYQPKYNVRLKDDKTFVKIRITVEHPYPRVMVTRAKTNDKSIFFGPYQSAKGAREMHRIIVRTFRLRSCSDNVFKNRIRPCLQYEIGFCSAPCVLPEQNKDYAYRVKEAVSFLRGHTNKIVKELKEKMRHASDLLDFEQAIHIKSIIDSIKTITEKQIIDINDSSDIDIFGFAIVNDSMAIEIFIVREGKLLHTVPYFFKLSSIERFDIFFSQLIRQYYLQNQYVPDLVIVPHELIEIDKITNELRLIANRQGIRVKKAERGTLKKLYNLAVKNALLFIEKNKKIEEKNFTALKFLKEHLSLPIMPRKIECYDISNIQGTHAYGSQVVFIDGVAANHLYRLYKIKTVEGIDDFAMLKEVISRRLTHQSNEMSLPDLFLIDGGEGQVNSVLEIVKKANINVPVVGISKKHAVSSKRLTAKKFETLHFNGRSYPLDPQSGDTQVKNRQITDSKLKSSQTGYITKNMEILKLVTSIRNEAHRFAISAFRHGKENTDINKGVALKIKGVGPKIRKKILMEFGSFDNFAIIMQKKDWHYPGINSRVMNALKKFFQKNEPE